MSDTTIKTRFGRGISFGSMENASELWNILNGLVQDGRINRYQLENQLAAKEKFNQKITAVLDKGSIIIILIVYIIAWRFDIQKTTVVEIAINLITFLISFYLLYKFTK